MIRSIFPQGKMLFKFKVQSIKAKEQLHVQLYLDRWVSASMMRLVSVGTSLINFIFQSLQG